MDPFLSFSHGTVPEPIRNGSRTCAPVDWFQTVPPPNTRTHTPFSGKTPDSCLFWQILALTVMVTELNEASSSSVVSRLVKPSSAAENPRSESTGRLLLALSPSQERTNNYLPGGTQQTVSLSGTPNRLFRWISVRKYHTA